MRAEVLERLARIARGEVVPVPGGTAGTSGTARVCGWSARQPRAGTRVRGIDPSFRAFRVFQPEHDEYDEAERAAIAVVDANVPAPYAEPWAAFQLRKPDNRSPVEWYLAVDDAGRFLDAWAATAVDFGWQPDDIFGRQGLAWFCRGECVRALGPDNAIAGSGRIFIRPASSSVLAIE